MNASKYRLITLAFILISVGVAFASFQQVQNSSDYSSTQNSSGSITINSKSYAKTILEVAPTTQLVVEPTPEFEYVTTLYFDISTYTPSSDGGKWGKRFASVNFLSGGKHFDYEKPYLKTWTQVNDSIARGEKVVAVPKWCEWIHTSRTEYKSGH